MQAADLEVIKEIPGYKVILKTVLKSQIQQLVEQLADHTGEESVILTASIADGSLSHLGSESGKVFLEEHDDMKSQFLGFCLKRHHKQKQIEKEKQEQEQQRQERQNAANTPQGYSVGPRPRFAPTRLTSGPRLRSTPGSGLHPVSLTRASSQGNAVIRTPGQRHQPYPPGRPRASFGQGVKRPGGAMRLPTEQNKTPKINVNANQVIKTEATDIENVGGNSVDQGAGDITVSGSMESSDGAVNSAIVNTGRSNSTLSQPESGESTNLSSIVKGEPPELPGIAGNGDITASGSYSEIAAPGGLSLGTDFSSITGISADSVQASTSVSPIEQHSSGSSLPGTVATVTEQNVLVKTEVEDDDEELEITGVEPGQMSVSDNAWMSNVQTSMGYDPSMSGAVNMGESTGPAQGYDPSMPGAVNMSGSSGQGYDRRFKECQLCGKQVLHTSLSNHMKLHSSERYSCSVCKKSFARKDYCLKHMFAVHQKMSRADLQC